VRSGPSNNRMQLTKAARCAPSAFRSWGQSLRAAFAADPGCCAETAGCTSTAKDDGSVPRFRSARSGAPRVPVAGRYGGRLQASAVIPGGGKAWPGSASLAQRHHLLHASVALSNSFSALQGSTAAGWLRLQQNRNATVPHNNAFERTRRVGVPRLRGAIVRVPPCRSTQCCTHLPGTGER